MSERQFYVNNGNDNMGPYTMETIQEMVQANTLKATDYLYLDDRDEWVMICQHPDFVKGFQNHKPKKSISEKTVITEVKVSELDHEPRQTEWFVLKDKNRLGPFGPKEIVKMLQEKSIFEYDFAWHQGIDDWKRIAELEDFSPENVRKLMSEKSGEVFYRRKHLRAKYDCNLIVHDNSKIWRGKSVELSEGGAGVVMENAVVAPGQTIFIHFKPGQHSQPFNVMAEVVSKRYQKGIKDKDAPVVYGVKFLNIQSSNKDEISKIKPAA